MSEANTVLRGGRPGQWHDGVMMANADIALIPLGKAVGPMFGNLAGERSEVAAFAYFADGLRLVGARYIRGGLVDRAEVPLRTVASDALAFGANAVAVAHNHPSGNAQPSRGDIAATRMLARVLHPLGVRVVDHWIVTRAEIRSFSALGLL
ncbi:JAB domain-containing protein [Stakelama marina]|uniref:JAB domain-containing protein n=1 Tax=Stakelama marina TaxID=2826939 RepID=A0A8T4IHB4_9SPHN|nr:JAB domain-containing protein [Stakelama marina]MBR0553264.1 JAB domain-containing protein [Stakelama marina]